MKIIDLINGSDLAELTSKKPLALVKFSACWCEPCQLLEPVFKNVMEKRNDLLAVTVNVDAHLELAQQYAVRSVPTLLLFKEGELTSQLSGLQTEAQLHDWLNQHTISQHL